jgi:AcrR family transcriptional regulator
MAATLKADIQKRIIDITTKLLEQNGIESITLASIAHYASISKGTIYYYYQSKEELLFAVTVHYLDRLAEDFIVWIEDEHKDTSLHRLIAYVLERGAHGNHARLHFYLLRNVTNSSENLRRKFLEKYDEWRKLLGAKIKHRLIPSMQNHAEEIASLLLALIDGIITQDMVFHQPIDTQSFSLIISDGKELIQK